MSNSPEYELNINCNDICRMCLQQADTVGVLNNIFCSDIVGETIMPVPRIFELITGLKITKCDGLPPRICQRCKQKLIEFYLFKEKCIKSHELLLQIFTSAKAPACDVIEEQNMPRVFNRLEQDEDFVDDSSRSEVATAKDFISHEESEQLILKGEPEIDNSTEVIVEVDARGSPHSTSDGYLTSYQKNIFYSDDQSVERSNNCETILYGNKSTQSRSASASEESETIEHITATVLTRRRRSYSKKFICPYCDVRIRGDDRVKRHMDFHNRTLSQLLDATDFFKCGTCCSIYLSLENLRTHMESEVKCEIGKRQVDNSCTDYQYLMDVEDSEETHETKRMLTIIKNHDDNFWCGHCHEFRNTSLDDVTQHIVDVHFMLDDMGDNVYGSPNPNETQRCGICNTVYPSVKDIRKHVYFHLPKFTCSFSECTDSFNTFAKLNTHLEQVHVHDREHICNHCNQKFTDRRSRIDHTQKKCSKRQRECSFCGKRFITSFCLQLHERIHTKEKRYMCQFCGKKFIQRGDLLTHKRMHTGEKPYKCGICEVSFRTSGHRRDHMSTHSDEKNFECNECGKKFKSRRILKGHTLLHNSSKKHQCTECGKAFARRQHVQIHMRTHLRRSEKEN